jgi:hypothetical protein
MKARTGWTKAPCHGCGRRGDYRGREKDKLCGECQKLLAEAQELKEGLAKTGETNPYLLPWAPHAFAYIPHCNFQSASDEFQRHCWNLLIYLGISDGDAWSSTLRPAVDGSDHGGRDRVIRLPPVVREAINGMFQSARKATEEAFENGRRNGQSLMLGLARGEVSMERFNEEAVGEITVKK